MADDGRLHKAVSAANKIHIIEEITLFPRQQPIRHIELDKSKVFIEFDSCVCELKAAWCSSCGVVLNAAFICMLTSKDILTIWCFGNMFPNDFGMFLPKSAKKKKKQHLKDLWKGVYVYVCL